MNLPRVISRLVVHHKSGKVWPSFGFAAICVLVAGCGGGSGPPPGPSFSGSTTVALQISSSANDQLSQFTMGIDSISLTNRAGGTITIFNTPTSVDFIAANGGAYPLATIAVPQDIYTSAAVTLSGLGFVYTFLDSTGTINIDHGAYTSTPNTTMVILPQTITVEGTALGLTLSLDVSKSLTMSDPTVFASSVNSGTPTFDLTAFPVTAQSTTPLDGKCIGLAGQVVSISATGGTMNVTLAGDGGVAISGNALAGYATGGTFTVGLTSGTDYQGVASASGLAPGTFVNVDLALEPDGSYTATRVEVQDMTTTNVTAGPVFQSNPSNDGIGSLPLQFEGSQLESPNFGNTESFVYANSTKFQTSARFPGLGTLPFTPVFNGSTVVAGQVTSIGAMSYPTTGGTFALPTTVTLIPQTIDAVVNGVSTSGSYSVYSVQLAPYDLIVQMNGPVANTTDLLLTNANVVQVYVGAGTSLLNSTPLVVGGTFRFNGLLFDDGGVLRMVAGQVNDGVPQ